VLNLSIVSMENFKRQSR